MCKYEMDPTRTIGATEWTVEAGQLAGQSDGVGYKNMGLCNQYMEKHTFSYNLYKYENIYKISVKSYAGHKIYQSINELIASWETWQ